MKTPARVRRPLAFGYRRCRKVALTVAACLLSSFPTLPVRAAAGDLDLTFGSGGRVVTDFGGDDFVASVAVQPDGKIVALGQSGGQFALARYNTDGSLDPGFGAGGKLTTAVTGFGLGLAVTLQPDGKIVGAGAGEGAGQDFAVVRYNADGSLDNGFGSGGIVLTDISGGDDVAFAVAIQPDGKIVLAGMANTNSDFAVARLNPDGSPDVGFGGSGVVVTDAGADEEIANGVAVQSDGRIVACGYTSRDPDGQRFALARYEPDGTPDATFGEGGLVTTSFPYGGGAANAVAIQPDGKMVAVGSANDAAGFEDFALARYNTDGSPDGSFGADGVALTDLFDSSDRAQAIALMPDGRIAAAGFLSSTTLGEDFALALYLPDGTLDATFGAGGKVATGFGDSANANAVAIQSGNIIAAGLTYSGGNLNFALCRYEAAGLTPQGATEQIIADVRVLAATGGLAQGEANSLTAKLQAAAGEMAQGTTTVTAASRSATDPARESNGAVKGQLDAFINEVKALMRSKRLAPAKGQKLIQEAETVLGLLAA
jgi:uncharacterized delta-60 repeat protein